MCSDFNTLFYAINLNPIVKNAIDYYNIVLRAEIYGTKSGQFLTYA